MFEEENDNKIYRLIISNGYDKNKEYMKFIEQIYSKNDFLWKESISGSYSTANKEFFEKIDVIILLAGSFCFLLFFIIHTSVQGARAFVNLFIFFDFVPKIFIIR